MEQYETLFKWDEMVFENLTRASFIEQGQDY